MIYTAKFKRDAIKMIVDTKTMDEVEQIGLQETLLAALND